MISHVELGEAVQILRGGGVLVYPTETSYALGCDATNDEAVARIFAIKGRPESKGTPLILPPEHDPALYILMSERALELVNAYWPGPLNIIAVRALSSSVSRRCETDGTQSVRKSSHAIAAELARQLDRPLVATSANHSGQSSIYRPDELEHEFFEAFPDAVLDVGALPVVPASTTVKVVDDKIEVIRQGAIIL